MRESRKIRARTPQNSRFCSVWSAWMLKKIQVLTMPRVDERSQFPRFTVSGVHSCYIHPRFHSVCSAWMLLFQGFAVLGVHACRTSQVLQCSERMKANKSQVLQCSECTSTRSFQALVLFLHECGSQREATATNYKMNSIADHSTRSAF